MFSTIKKKHASGSKSSIEQNFTNDSGGNKKYRLKVLHSAYFHRLIKYKWDHLKVFVKRLLRTLDAFDLDSKQTEN